jgi:hypothetical protein
MIMRGALAKRRRLLAIAVGAATAIAVLGSSRTLDEMTGASRGAAAATTTALVPARIAAHRRPAPPPSTDASVAHRSGVLLIFLIEAAGPQALFAR